jgi:hypothetical protein
MILLCYEEEEVFKLKDYLQNISFLLLLGLKIALFFLFIKIFPSIFASMVWGGFLLFYLFLVGGTALIIFWGIKDSDLWFSKHNFLNFMLSIFLAILFYLFWYFMVKDNTQIFLS